MKCEQVREALSARMDGEDPATGQARLDAHVAGCAGCAGWLEQARQVTRAVLLEPVEVPDLTARVLAAVAVDPVAARVTSTGRGAPRSRRTILRIAVAVAAVAQFALALPLLSGAAHLGREIAVFELALAAGFGFVAWRPEWARALVPVAVVLAAGLALTSVVDVVNARVNPLQETAHLAAVVQAGLVWALARTEPPAPPHRIGNAVATQA
jgi:predicted anti-sigma-YlaC factor YlaD